MLFTCGCTMDTKALSHMLKLQKDVVYCDEKIGGTIFRKPDYSPHTLMSHNYIGPCLIRAELLDKSKTLYENLIALSAKGASFGHVSQVLAEGNRRFEENTSAYEAKGKVSIIIPSKDNYDVLKRCIHSIRDKSTYKNYEIIIADNGSGAYTQEKYAAIADKYVYRKMDFNFSCMCNTGAEKAEGDALLFLNDDTEVISHDWLEKMLSLALLKNAGAIGAKLYYPQSRVIQHCGIINISNGPVHAFIGQEDNDLYFGRSRYNYNCIAVTGACLCIDKNKFLGFDENFSIAYNDVDMCFSLYEKGLYNIVCNDALLYHHESLSRGNDLIDKNNRKHMELLGRDPFYSRRLTQLRGDFKEYSVKDTLISPYKTLRLVL